MSGKRRQEKAAEDGKTLNMRLNDDDRARLKTSVRRASGALEVRGAALQQRGSLALHYIDSQFLAGYGKPGQHHHHETTH